MGSIIHTMELIVKFQGHHEKITAEVMDLGKNLFILGFSWLSHVMSQSELIPNRAIVAVSALK